MSPPRSGRIRVGFTPTEPLLIPHRIHTRLPAPTGKDVEFSALTHEGPFYCKGDTDGQPVRATEMVCTQLAAECGLATPYCAVVESGDETFFGSLDVGDAASRFEVSDFIMRGQTDEIGNRDPWLGRYLSAIFAFDLALQNPDRGTHNFVMAANDNVLRVMDFADSRIVRGLNSTAAFMASKTVQFGRLMKSLHGFDLAAAREMLERLQRIPSSLIRKKLEDLPEGWCSAGEGERLCEMWDNEWSDRLAVLSAGLTNGELL